MMIQSSQDGLRHRTFGEGFFASERAIKGEVIGILDDLHFVRIQSYGIAQADTAAVIPTSADPRPSEFIDLLANGRLLSFRGPKWYPHKQEAAGRQVHR